MDRRRVLTILLPTGVSLAVHLALLALIAAVSITAVRLASSEGPTREVVVTLEAPAPSDPPPTNSALPAPASAATALAVAPTVVAPPSGGLAAPPIATSVPPPALPPAGAPAIDMRRALSSGAAFAGLTASRVRRVVYVVDISGPMTSSLSFVLDEVRRSVSRLDPSQYFQVVLFSQDIDDPAAAGTMCLGGTSDRARLLPASASNRALLAQFLDDVRPGGRSNPLAGLRRALAWEPDVIFLLARGIARTGPDARWGEGVPAILARLDELNPVNRRGLRRTAIKTIQFVDDDPTGLMQAIAAAHGNTPSEPSSSYSRRNVEDLRQDRPEGMPRLDRALDPGIDRAASLLGDLSTRRLDLRVAFDVASEDERAEVARVAARVSEQVAGADADDELASLLLARALVLRAAAELHAPVGPRIDVGATLGRAIEGLDTGQGAPPEVLGTAAMARALRRAPGDAAEVERLALRVLEIDPTTLGALEARLSAIMAMADNPPRVEPWVRDLEASVTRAPLFVGGRLDAGLVLLSFNVAARARLVHAVDPHQIEAALSVHRRWWLSPRPGLPGDAVLAAAGSLLDADAPLDRLAPEFALARGLALLPTQGQAPSDACLRAFDIARARDLARGGASESAPSAVGTADMPAAGVVAEQASIRAAMAVSLYAQNDADEATRRDAVARLDECISEFPARSWRRDAALHLLAHTGALLARYPRDDTLARPRVRALEALVVESPRAEDGASLDAWRLELAQRLAESDDGEQELRALDLLASEWHARPGEAIDRLSAWIRARRVARSMQALARAQAAGDQPAIRDAATEAISEARAGIQPADRCSPGAADALRADLAEALIAVRSPEASSIYAGLHERGVVLGGSRWTATLGQARALDAQGDAAGAFGVLRGLTKALPAPPEAEGDHDVFWGAWALTLEILSRRARASGDEEAAQTARAHLLRLASLDPRLGGERWHDRIESTALSLGVRLGEREQEGQVHSQP